MYLENIGSSYKSINSANADLDSINEITRNTKSKKGQLEKLSKEFESIFVAKMLNEMDKTIDKTGSLFQESKYLDNLKSFMYNDIARNIANNPQTSIGIAKQMYTQLEKTIKE